MLVMNKKCTIPRSTGQQCGVLPLKVECYEIVWLSAARTALRAARTALIPSWVIDRGPRSLEALQFANILAKSL